MQSREDDDAAPSDLNRMAAYQFSQLGPDKPPGLGRPGSDLPPRPEPLFLANPIYILANPCKFENL
jgi:hypothetical protein